jgi:tRNA threonylcarbamoyladenosine biosynthesis protein TsaB
MKLLAFDTSTEACSVALWLDGVCRERIEHGTRHSERILAMVEEALAEGALRLRQLDAIAFGRGPGSFTSLRIGSGVVQGLAFGADLPVVPVSSLAALAQGANAGRVLAAFDARMNQVYWGAFIRDSAGLVEPASAEIVVDPSRVPLPEGEDWIGVGSGWDACSEMLASRLGARLSRWERGVYPRACDVAKLAAAAFAAGRTVTPEQAVPVYIRDDVAARPKGSVS